MTRSLLTTSLTHTVTTTAKDVTMLFLPHGGQRTARRNAWNAAAVCARDGRAGLPLDVARSMPRRSSGHPLAVGGPR